MNGFQNPDAGVTVTSYDRGTRVGATARRESGTKARVAKGDWNSMVRSQLVELGQRALSAVTAGMAAGAPLTKCQLLASEFYEALQRELRRPSSAGEADRAALMVAASQCERIAKPSIRPSIMLEELGRALATLQTAGAESSNLLQRSRPVLHVIKGGLSI